MDKHAAKLWKFSGRLFCPEGPRMMTVLPIPTEVAQAGGFRARQRVKGRIDGAPIATSLQSSGDGWFAFVVNKELLKKLGRAAGDLVKVAIELDDGPVVVAAPPALRTALKAKPRAEAAFSRLAPSHKKAYVEWISSAKQTATRDRRVRTAVQMLAEGKKLR